MHLCWVLLQTRGVVDLASLFNITAFYTAMFHMHINEPWLIASPPIYYIWKCVESCAKINDQHLHIHMLIYHTSMNWNKLTTLSLSWSTSCVCYLWCHEMLYTISNSGKWMWVNGEPLHLRAVYKKPYFLLQVMWESISVLWVMQESISGTASHATTLASYPGRVGANWLHAEWVAPPLAA